MNQYLQRLTVFSVSIFCLISSNAYSGDRYKSKKVKKIIERSAVLKNHHIGFALYDLDKNKTVAEYNADKYFTPASNTKLFTFYASLKMLGDSIPGLRYIVKNDSLIFWGTGDPSFLQTNLKCTSTANFLRNSSYKLFYAERPYDGTFYGSGWGWGDYTSYYMAEICSFPFHDNVLKITSNSHGGLNVSPSIFTPFFRKDLALKLRDFYVQRSFYENDFSYPDMPIPAKYVQETPFKYSSNLLIKFFQDTLKRQVEAIKMSMPADAKTFYSINSDAVYKQMLQPSDNFIAEQLLLVCSSTKWDTLSTRKSIDYVKKELLSDMSDSLNWSDGSGLSRYNLFTPNTMISLLQKIYATVPEERLFKLLAIGGKEGTIRNFYKAQTPFVFAKTGTLRNNHNLSGYLITKSGKRLMFSFMNNNYTVDTKLIQKEMERILTEIHENY